MLPRGYLIAGLLGFLLVHHLPADEPKEKSVEQLAEQVKPSIAVITGQGRDGKRHGIGSGFVVGDGLVATNFHVIGEGRAITVEFADGKKYQPTHVHAVDRIQDLAIIRIDAKDLKTLKLADSDKLKDGQSVVAVGNPQGLKFSVVAGVASGRREIDGRTMIQVAIPIEPGNSGGPLLDRTGQVHGILTIKSLVTPNLGFAVASNALKPLLAKPTPIPMDAWLTLGALDPEDWQVKFGANWRQRAGRIQVEGPGTGFGGRALLLSRRPEPEIPYEIGVSVRLGDEAGAAGLVFHSDGEQVHYGFYPTGGKFRLTRFDGPDVYSWKILEEKATPHYLPGEWNALKVRVEKGRLRCFVNDQLVIESDDTGLTSGKVGLAKFRDTVAEFKNFRVGSKLTSTTPPGEVKDRILKAIEGIPDNAKLSPELLGKIAPNGAAGLNVLRERARQLELQAAQLRQLAQAVHEKSVLADLEKINQGKDEGVDLVHAALLLARLDNEEVDVDHYRKEVDRMAKKISSRLAKNADDKAKRAALDEFFFRERGFHGSRSEYYHRSNSYLSEVIDDREGLPITLSVLYLELAKRIGLHAFGVGLPGHFVVGIKPSKGDLELIDVFEGGKVLTREEAAKKVEEITGRPLTDSELAPMEKRLIAVRMLRNLQRVASDERDDVGGLRYANAILTLNPDSVEERVIRMGLRYRTGDRDGALKDVDWLLEKKPAEVDQDRLREFRKLLTRP